MTLETPVRSFAQGLFSLVPWSPASGLPLGPLQNEIQPSPSLHHPGTFASF